MSDGRDGHAVESVDEQLQGLLDQKAVREVMRDYCRGVDRRDFDLITAPYHQDAFDHHGTFEGGRDAVVTQVARTTVTAGASHEPDDRTHEFGPGARHPDRFEKRDGHWARSPSEEPWHSFRNSSS